MGLNPFDWPEVLQPRKAAMDLLERLSREPLALNRVPRLQESGIQLFAEGHTRSEISNLSLPEALRSFLRLREQDGFVVLFSYLERSSEVETWLRELRELFTRQLSVPVLIYHGPRCYDQYAYLCHSGLPPALYIVLTADYPVDIPIPGANYTFSQLHRALVLGEFESMSQSDRLAIRLNVCGEQGESMANLKHVFEQALPKPY